MFCISGIWAKCSLTNRFPVPFNYFVSCVLIGAVPLVLSSRCFVVGAIDNFGVNVTFSYRFDYGKRWKNKTSLGPYHGERAGVKIHTALQLSI